MIYLVYLREGYKFLNDVIKVETIYGLQQLLQFAPWVKVVENAKGNDVKNS